MSDLPEPRFFQLPTAPGQDAVQELLAGLAQTPAAVAPKFLYDALGSALFGAITELDEYYPTRTEAAIFAAHAAEMAALLHSASAQPMTLVDLGAGDGAKAARLFDSFAPAHYVAVDISTDYLRLALRSLQLRHPQLRMTGVGLDFSQQLALPSGILDGPATLFYPGSSIGNFAPPQALRLLSQARELSQGGALLIGADLCKPVAVLEAAYDDALGVTAAFNLNLLRHLNRLVGSDFNPRQWQHVALFNSALSRIEMHLQARQDLQVNWPGGGRAFAAGERVHTENSYKWRPQDFESLLRDAGWRNVRRWTDDQGWFGVFLAQA